MREAQMQSLFGTYLKNHPPSKTESYELKICKGTALPFDAVKKHQIKGLLDAENSTLFHKISDFPVFQGGKMKFNHPKPFDCFILVGVKSYVVLWFYKPRKQKVFIKIGIKDFIQLKESVDRKSITEEMAIKIGELLYI